MRLVVGALLLAAAAAAKTTHGTIRCQRSGLGLGRAAARGGETVHDVAATVLKPWNGTRWNGTAPPRHTIVFLLGYAYSGTSAAHWLLGQSPTVSTLRDPDTMSPAKEGWAIDGLKKRTKNRWRDDDDWIPWARLEKTSRAASKAKVDPSAGSSRRRRGVVAPASSPNHEPAAAGTTAGGTSAVQS